MQQVSVQKNETGIAPKWKSISGFDIPFELSQEVGRILTNDIHLEFLDLPAQRVLKAEQDSQGNLGWANEKWIMESSSEHSKLYLWTFAGDKINRAVSILLSTKFKQKPNYDYKKVIIDIENEELKSLSDFQHLISSFKSKTVTELEDAVKDKVKVIWFSKFSDCLPDALAKNTICEKGIDFEGLIRELNKVSLRWV